MDLYYLIIFIILFGYILERVLDYLNLKNWSAVVPERFRDIYNQTDYSKAQLYDREHKKLNLVSDTLYTGIMILLIHCGTFGRLDNWLVENCSGNLQATLMFFGILGLVSEIINLPFSIYRTFVIEEHFGFNKTTASTFIKDRVKGYIIAILLIGGIISLFSWFYNTCGTNFWLYAWIAISIIMILMSMFYTTIILPLFNKLVPLEQGELRDAIEAYCRKTGFGLSDVYVMDGSKRSSKSNAFFSGLGSKKKIVLYDTLIQNHTVPELVSILAHETGHYKLRHTLKGIIISIFQTGIMLYLFSWFMKSTEVVTALGGSHHTIELGLLAFGILYSPVSLVMGVIVNKLSRIHEFQADSYAAKTYDALSLQTALKKLSVNNLSNLNPHPAYVFFYYSHPPLPERLSALDRVHRTS